jgi:imidazolonepropionase-like amidohydrolase
MSRHYAVVAASYFDGEKYFPDGPYTVIVENGNITEVAAGDFSEELEKRKIPVRRAPFLMPGLVEAHCHLFLDGGQLDFQVRSEYLNATSSEMQEVARANVAANLAAGVTLVVDAGDRYGINHDIRRESRRVAVRSAGLGLRSPGRYGSFMAREVASHAEIEAAVREIGKTADDLKVILTGIIDFEAGGVKGKPQFNTEELRLIVSLARRQGLRTLVHCSGIDGLETAVAAGVDSIEHGFFMTREVLQGMAEQGIAWVPTFSPVHFQWQHPEIAGWNEQTVANLRRILDSHLEHVGLAAELGVPLIAGSDAGSHGVRHGAALIDELDFFAQAGLPMEELLRSATSLPRRRWGVAPAGLAAGQRAECVALAGSPFEDPAHLHHVTGVFTEEGPMGTVPAKVAEKKLLRSAVG